MEHFLAPSFEAHAAAPHDVRLKPDTTEVPGSVRLQADQASGAADHASGAADHAGAAAEHAPAAHGSHAVERWLMVLSVLIAIGGVLTARHFYLTRPQIPKDLAARWPGVHALLFNKYYVDELYNGTVIRGTLSSGRGLFTFDRRVVDGAVNGSGWLTQIGAWGSHMTDKYVVDGFVNFVGWGAGEGSYLLRRLQTGLVQNYALLMILGVFGFLTVYLFAR
jgi:NADH-quinone oxidoreductase subunit L